MMGYSKKLDALLDRYKLKPLKGVMIFMLITVIIHFAWRLWAYRLHYFPIQDFMNTAGNFMADIVFRQGSWLVQHVLGMEITTANNTMYFSNNGYIAINSSCSGLKPMVQFVLLMMLYPGPWKKKLWFIPMGVVVVHLTNLFRVTGLSVVIMEWPNYWHFSHDYLFRPFFYVVIFAMWLWWEEKLRR